MVRFTHISHKNRNLSFLCKTEPKPNGKWNRRTVTALVPQERQVWVNP